MKKIISLLGLMVLIVPVMLAQGSNLSISSEETFLPEPIEKPSKRVLAKLKAEEDFLKWNKNAEQVRWYEETNGFFVYYTTDGKKARSFYDKRGYFVYNLISYPEQFLPVKIKKLIKSVYYMDYRITHVNEILQDNKTVFLVMITDDKVWKKLRIMDEIEEIEEIKAYEAK